MMTKSDADSYDGNIGDDDENSFFFTRSSTLSFFRFQIVLKKAKNLFQYSAINSCFVLYVLTYNLSKSCRERLELWLAEKG